MNNNLASVGKVIITIGGVLILASIIMASFTLDEASQIAILPSLIPPGIIIFLALGSDIKNSSKNEALILGPIIVILSVLSIMVVPLGAIISIVGGLLLSISAGVPGERIQKSVPITKKNDTKTDDTKSKMKRIDRTPIKKGDLSDFPLDLDSSADWQIDEVTEYKEFIEGKANGIVQRQLLGLLVWSSAKQQVLEDWLDLLLVKWKKIGFGYIPIQGKDTFNSHATKFFSMELKSVRKSGTQDVEVVYVHLLHCNQKNCHILITISLSAKTREECISILDEAEKTVKCH